MTDATTTDLLLYLQLAWASQVRSRPIVCDKLLVLVAADALRRQMHDLAATARDLILLSNPGHLLRQFESFDDAVTDARLEAMVDRIRREYPRERAEHMLVSLDLTPLQFSASDSIHSAAVELLDQLHRLRSEHAPSDVTAPPPPSAARESVPLGAIVAIAILALALAVATIVAIV